MGAATTNLGTLFRDVPADRAAIVDLGGQRVRRLTYGELDAMADAVARGLVRRGLRTGETIAIASLNRLEYIALLFGALRAGIVPVPLNVKLKADALAHIVSDSAVRLIFAEPAFARLLPAGVPVVDLDADYDGFLDPGPFTPVAVEADTVSMLPYTSGSTGRPKGVLLTHGGQAWAAEVLTRHRRIAPDERPLIAAPFYHKNAIVAIKTGLLPGACLIVMPRFEARAYVEAIAVERCTMITGVPTMMRLVLNEPRLAEIDRSAVTTVSMGSSPASDQLLADLTRAFPNAAIQLNYGSTEGGPIMFGWFHPEGRPRPPHSVGYPIPGCEWRLGDRPGTTEGELWVRNPGVARGYLNRPDATAESFVDGWYRTADVLRHDEDGWFYFIGRTDDMFVCGGENVFPGAVEALLERHPDVRQAAVLPFPDTLKGEVPWGFVVAEAGRKVDQAALVAYTIENGPAYAHPRKVIFVDEIPLTGTNKIDKAALRRAAETIQASEAGR